MAKMNRIKKRSLFYLLIIFSFVLINLSPQLYSMGRTGDDELELLRIFHQTAVEEELSATQWDSGNTTISNEHRIDLFFDKIKDLGEGYIGVGTTQNFTLASIAKSKWIWLVDFTRIVTAANKIHIAFLKEAETSNQFMHLWQGYSRKKAYNIIRNEYKGSADLAFLLRTWEKARPFVKWRFRCLRHVTARRKYSTWYTDANMYRYIRTLAIKGHIKPLKGDLNGTRTIKSIADSANNMDVTIRVIYLSNAEEFFDYYSPQFRKNILEIPTDSSSILLRTATIDRNKYPWAPGSDYQNPLGFHYNIMPVGIFKEWLEIERQLELRDLLQTGNVIEKTGLSIIEDSPE